MNKDALLFGLFIVIIGTIISAIFGKIGGVDLPPVCEKWNENYIMELSLFFTGAITYVVFQKIKN